MDDAMRAEVADEIEAAGSPLCDCDTHENPPTSWQDRSVRLAHHCECPAVLASATIRRGQSMTLHERECSDHGYRERFNG